MYHALFIHKNTILAYGLEVLRTSTRSRNSVRAQELSIGYLARFAIHQIHYITESIKIKQLSKLGHLNRMSETRWQGNLANRRPNKSENRSIQTAMKCNGFKVVDCEGKSRWVNHAIKITAGSRRQHV